MTVDSYKVHFYPHLKAMTGLQVTNYNYEFSISPHEDGYYSLSWPELTLVP